MSLRVFDNLGLAIMLPSRIGLRRFLISTIWLVGCLYVTSSLPAQNPSATTPLGPDARSQIGRVEFSQAPIPAFPGAEGAGAWTRGGRGGKIFIVKNLNDAGPASFREAAEASGPRTIVFAVAGIIDLKSPVKINHPYVTLAGQTAPGDGICIKGETTEINTHDVIVRYLRFRRGNLKRRDDSLGGNPVGNIIVDHVSASWGLDENLTLYRHMVPMPDGSPADKRPVENITIQWSISSEALNLNNHAFGGTWGGKNCSFHHNLFACNTGRNPSIGMSFGFDFRNNVLFNWQHRTIDGGDGSSRVNLVNNYYKAGPTTPDGPLRYRIAKAQARNHLDRYPGFGKWYVVGNVVEGFPQISANNWAGGVQYDGPTPYKDTVVPGGSDDKVRSIDEFPAKPVTTHSALEAYELVLAKGGASLPRRDAVDVRVMEMVRTGKVTFQNGIIDLPSDVGGWPVYAASDIPVDADDDGMPDAWEAEHKLSDPNADADGDGYTNLEEYLNEKTS